MKVFARKLIPKQLRMWRMTYLTFGADIQKYYKSLGYNDDNLKSNIIMICHVIEKGLTMPKPRLGFGEERVINLCDLLYRYEEQGYDVSAFEIQYALMVLNEYLLFHNKHQYQLKVSIKNLIEQTSRHFNNLESTMQLHFTKEKFVRSCSSPFPEFSQSRYTVRNYLPDPPTLEDLISAVKMAQNAPSSCNRQPVRVYIITRSDLIKKILEMQGGSRGFGDLATALFVITANVSYFSNIIERTQPSLNAGFFGMSLLYALHSKQIGAATLNWSQDKRKDKKLSTMLNVPENEQIQFLISCGKLPDEFSVAASLRRDVNSIIRIIEQ